jgi:hypothetical protein
MLSVPFPAHTITSRLKIARPLHALRTAVADRQMRRHQLDSLLARRAPEAMPQDPADLMFLYWAITKRGPERCIEFGSGQSTLFIAEALHARGHGHLWSLDADADWLAHTEQMLPDYLRTLVTFVHSPVRVHRIFGPQHMNTRYCRKADGTSC